MKKIPKSIAVSWGIAVFASLRLLTGYDVFTWLALAYISLTVLFLLYCWGMQGFYVRSRKAAGVEPFTGISIPQKTGRPLWIADLVALVITWFASLELFGMTAALILFVMVYCRWIRLHLLPYIPVPTQDKERTRRVVFTLAREVLGSSTSATKVWFSSPMEVFGGRSAEDMVANGHAETVIAELERIGPSGAQRLSFDDAREDLDIR